MSSLARAAQPCNTHLPPSDASAGSDTRVPPFAGRKPGLPVLTSTLVLSLQNDWRGKRTRGAKDEASRPVIHPPTRLSPPHAAGAQPRGSRGRGPLAAAAAALFSAVSPPEGPRLTPPGLPWGGGRPAGRPLPQGQGAAVRGRAAAAPGAVSAGRGQPAPPAPCRAVPYGTVRLRQGRGAEGGAARPVPSPRRLLLLHLLPLRQ